MTTTAPVLNNNVTLFEGISQLSATPANIQLHDDRLVVTKVEGEEIIIDTPLNELTVGGSGAMLTFKVGDFKRRVDFDFGARAALLAPGGIALSAAIANESGIKSWLKEFRARKVRVTYVGMGRIFLYSVGGFVAILAGVAVYAGVS
jgi:hypothetical protein